MNPADKVMLLIGFACGATAFIEMMIRLIFDSTDCK